MILLNEKDCGRMIKVLSVQSTKNIFIVSPFIKIKAVNEAFVKTKRNVRFTVITRWLPDEILNGVCDPEVFEFLNHKFEVDFYLLNSVHSKIYIFDERYFFIGSGNFTSKGLGFVEESNHEAFLHFEKPKVQILGFVNEILEKSSKVDFSYYSKIIKFKKENEKMIKKNAFKNFPKIDQTYKFYVLGMDLSVFLSNKFTSWKNEFEFLTEEYQIFGKDKEDLQKKIVEKLLGLNIVYELSVFCRKGKYFKDILEFIKKHSDLSFGSHFQAKEYTARLLDWIVYFLPGYFERNVPNVSQLITCIKAITG